MTAKPISPAPSHAQDTLASAESVASTAKRSSFYLAMRILPAAQRSAMFEIYSFCRAVDDIADDGGCRVTRRARLNGWRRAIDALYPQLPPDLPAGAPIESVAVRAELAPAIARFDLRKEDFVAVIDGMQMDLDEDIQAPSFDMLDLYCDRVASAVGRLSTQVFGLPRETGVMLAYHLGRALQFTNILRDIDEDAAINRLYLARESLIEAGIAERTPAAVLAAPGLPVACDWLARAATVHYEKADALMRSAPRAAVKAPRLMSVAYHEVLTKTLARGWAAPRQRVSASRTKLLFLLLRYGLF